MQSEIPGYKQGSENSVRSNKRTERRRKEKKIKRHTCRTFANTQHHNGVI